jgi:hypothetical protein
LGHGEEGFWFCPPESFSFFWWPITIFLIINSSLLCHFNKEGKESKNISWQQISCICAQVVALPAEIRLPSTLVACINKCSCLLLFI